MKILFRTSGGSNPKNELGMGHIYRCINLSKKLESHENLFLIEDFGSVTKLFKENNLKIIKLRSDISEHEDIEKTIRCVKQNKIDILIIDRYGIKNSYVKALKKQVKVVVITDLYNIQYKADLIINGFIGYENSVIFNRFKTKCLLGPKYQILNDYYQKIHKKKKKFDLVISLGGFDAKCITEKILSEIILMNYNFKTLVILGPATKKTRKIKKIEKGFKENIKIIKEPKNFQNEISKAEIGIIGGGISTYESARLKIPFGIICQYRHQIITSREWAKKNIAENLGMFNFELNTKTKSFLEKIDQDRLRLKTMKKTEFSDSRKVLSEILRLKDD
jgi:spore coat polysaccharide biosynthesis predicted glycosyltransferase SpsG